MIKALKLLSLTKASIRKMNASTALHVVASFLKGAPYGALILVLWELFNPPIDTKKIIWAIVFAVVAVILELVIAMFAHTKNHIAAYSLTADTRLKLGEHLRRLSLGFFKKRDPGDITALLLQDLDKVEQVFSHLYNEIISSFVIAVMIASFMFFTDWRLALSAIIVVPIAIPVLLIGQKVIAYFGRKHIHSRNHAVSRFLEYLQGIKVIKAFNLKGEKFKNLDDSFKKLRSDSIKMEAAPGPLIISYGITLEFGLIVILLTGAYLLFGGTLSVTVFLTFMVLSVPFYTPLLNIGLFTSEIRYMSIGADRITSVIKTEPLHEPEEDEKLKKFDVKFKNVTFKGYTDFNNAQFKGTADFSDVTFEGTADFRNAKFKEEATFFHAVIGGYAIFIDVTFSREVNFTAATFKEDAEFMSAEFNGDAYFIDVTFENKAEFKLSKFKEIFKLYPKKNSEIGFTYVHLSDNVRVKADLSKCSFDNSNIERVDMTDSRWIGNDDKPKKYLPSIIEKFKNRVGISETSIKILFPLLSEHSDIILKVLDIGAGAGIYSLILSRLGYECHAVDTWSEYEELYNNRMGNKKDILERFEKSNVKTKECDILASPLPFPDGEFDLVLFLDVIEHLKTPKKALKEISRVLHRGGYVIIETPNTASLSNRVKALFGKSVYAANLDYWFNTDQFFGHLREYTATEIMWMLEQCGFECVKQKKTDASLFATPITYREHCRINRNEISYYSRYCATIYNRSFKIKSVRDILRSLYLTVTFIVPTFRGTTIVVARKS